MSNVKPQRELLAKLFSNYEVPKSMFQKNQNGWFSGIGSRKFTKIILFANEVQLDNDDVDYWMHKKPQREPGETNEAYKQRSLFSKNLDKYRSYIYDYSVYNEQKSSVKRAKKIMKQLGINQ